MQYSSTILLFSAVFSVSALPLNINLGAYSPALVVGDGEISFGAGEEATALVNTLAGASVSNEAAAAVGVKQAGEVTPTIVTAESASASSTPTTLPLGAFGIGRSIQPRPRSIADSSVDKEKRDIDTTEKRDLSGFNAALTYATGALTTSPGVELGTGEGGSGVGIIVKPGGAVAKREEVEERGLPTVTLLKIRTLGGNGGQ